MQTLISLNSSDTERKNKVNEWKECKRETVKYTERMNEWEMPWKAQKRQIKAIKREHKE